MVATQLKMPDVAPCSTNRVKGTPMSHRHRGQFDAHVLDRAEVVTQI
jgi:hypothetical protein